ncbi:(R,R)-butanediol dehydrogenase, partial [Bacillus sp. LR--39]
IYAVELSPERQQKAEELGAIIVDPSKTDDVVAEIAERTGGGVDVAFEVTGVPVVLRQAIQSTTIAGETVIVSIWEKGAEIHPNDIVIKERTVKGIIGYRDIFPAVLSLMEEGYFSADKLVTKKIVLDDLIEEGFGALIKEKSQVKILVRPN